MTTKLATTSCLTKCVTAKASKATVLLPWASQNPSKWIVYLRHQNEAEENIKAFQRIIRVYHDDDNAAISLDYFSENIAILENDEDWNEEDHDDVKNVNPNPWEWAKEDFEELIL